MKPIEPLALHHSWPIFDSGQHFDLGFVHGVDGFASAGPSLPAFDATLLARHGVGLWQCNLADNKLSWSGEVHDAFGLPRDAILSRSETVALYDEHSRAAMERLRAHAIRHRRGFTLDVKIKPAQGSFRWIRLMAAPVCVDGRVVKLHGLKQDITADYR